MRAYSFPHLSPAVLLREMPMLDLEERRANTLVLARIAEIDDRKLYREAGFDSMLEYCMRELGWQREAAKKRLHIARTARSFPAIFAMLDSGGLHRSAVLLLAPYLTQENAPDLLATAAGRSKVEIERLLAERFPRTELLELTEQARSSSTSGSPGTPQVQFPPGPGSPGTLESRPPNGSLAKIEPTSTQSYALHVTIDCETHELLESAQSLLSHRMPSGDIAQVLKQALKTLVHRLEKEKFAATERRAQSRRPTRSARHIPADVQRAVWERDQGRCTFVGITGQRCGSRERVEFDHLDPVGRGGIATTENVRLLCRAHNQLEAERCYGAGFMAAKRQAAHKTDEKNGAGATSVERGRNGIDHESALRQSAPNEQAACARSRDEQRAHELHEQIEDVIAAMRGLGFRADRAREAAKHAATLPDATLEDRIRAALRYLRPKTFYQRGAGSNAG